MDVIELSKGEELALATEEPVGTAADGSRLGQGEDRRVHRQRCARRRPGRLGVASPGPDADMVFYNNLQTRDGSVVHLGDNLSGRGEGDDEVLTVDLTRVHPKIDTIVFQVSSYQGHTLEWIRNAYCRLVDEHDVSWPASRSRTAYPRPAW